MFTYAIIICSDKGYKGERVDGCQVVIENQLLPGKYQLVSSVILPDEQVAIEVELRRLVDELKVDLVLTSGGTGFSIRDVTPEATKKVIEREVPGIAEAMRYYSLAITKKAMLSRAIAGISKQTLIINLPGSPKAVKESLAFILDALEHGLDILKGSASECAVVD